MSELKLYGMRASFDEFAGKVLSRRDEIYPLLARLILAEYCCVRKNCGLIPSRT